MGIKKLKLTYQQQINHIYAYPILNLVKIIILFK